MTQDQRPGLDQIRRQAERYEPALSTRQAETVAAWMEGYDPEEMIELFAGYWGDESKVSISVITQALDPGLEKLSAARRLMDDYQRKVENGD